jgi:hypothetical protein
MSILPAPEVKRLQLELLAIRADYEILVWPDVRKCRR